MPNYLEVNSEKCGQLCNLLQNFCACLNFSVTLPRVWSVFFIPSELAVLKVPELHLQVGADGVPGQHGHRELCQSEGGTVPLNRVPHITDLQHRTVPPCLRVQHRVVHLDPVIVQLHHGGLRWLVRLLSLVLFHLLRLHQVLGDAIRDASQHLAQRLVLVPQHVLVASVQREGDGELGLPGETPHHGRLHRAEEAASPSESTR